MKNIGVLPPQRSAKWRDRARRRMRRRQRQREAAQRAQRRAAQATRKRDPRVAAIVRLTNARRTGRGLGALTWNDDLAEAAQAQADYQARTGQMSHVGAGGSHCWDRIEAAGYDYRRCGENVAEGYDDVEELQAAWVASLLHRKNIDGPFKEIGVAERDGYWCVTFGTR